MFTEQNKEILATIPPPKVAVEYYNGSDTSMFESFQVTPEARCRRPKCETMLDIFNNIIEDEVEHKHTMVACQNPQEVARQIAETNQELMCDIETGEE